MATKLDQRVKALKDFWPHIVINRADHPDVVEAGNTIMVSENDAQYLERDGYAERVPNDVDVSEATTSTETPPPTADTPPTADDSAGTDDAGGKPEAGNAGETSDPAAKPSEPESGT